jgi:DNA-binding response OmpR family regulator
LIERLRLYSSKNPLISIIPSAVLPARSDFDAVLLPATLLLDPAFPRTEAIHRLRAAGCSLICFGAAELLQGCFLAGCDEYLREPWSPEELEWRVRKLCKDREALYCFSWGRFTIQSQTIGSPAGSCALCAQEQSILRLLAANSGEPVSREALYYGIWGRPAAEGSRAVDMHIASLRRKLRALFPESGACIRSVRGVGYLIVK